MGQKKRWKILIIDDDPEFTSSVGEILKSHDYEVMVAHDGLQAIENSRNKTIDLILLDIRLPFFSGFWFCDAFKQRPQTKDIPVVVVSGLSEAENIQKAYRVGASAYLKKPFRAEKLLEVVEQTLSD